MLPEWEGLKGKRESKKVNVHLPVIEEPIRADPTNPLPISHHAETKAPSKTLERMIIPATRKVCRRSPKVPESFFFSIRHSLKMGKDFVFV